MKIELKEITVKELTDGYVDNSEAGVVACCGTLDIRPPYQREFIYITIIRRVMARLIILDD